MTIGGAARDPIAGEDLADVLAASLVGDDAADLARVILALADAAVGISRLLGRGSLAGQLGLETAKPGVAGDKQKRLDVLANDQVRDALAASPTAYFASEEEDEILALNPAAPFAVAVDPLDGSSNIDINASIGTIFSVFRASPDGASASFFRRGREQVAAGYFVYGPHTDMVLTVGDGVDLFALDSHLGRFVGVQSQVRIPPHAYEFAINASNYRHWYDPVCNFFEECLAGSSGSRGVDFNMRWPAAMVVDAHRILHRGGIYLYPADRRRGYEKGRLRLLYEAFPIAWIMEEATGRATDGTEPILDKTVTALHQRTPLIFGSARDVVIVGGFHENPPRNLEQAPLFGRRGLFRDRE